MIFPKKVIGKKDKEVVIFGKGYGESILIHLSGHKYILIDSFINNDTGNPIAVDYLNSVGLSANDIIGIICTHWDNDHCLGLTDLVDKHISGKADIYVPGIDDFDTIKYILSLASGDANSTREVASIISSDNDISPIFESCNLFPDKMPIVDEHKSSFFALSPSRKQFGKFVSMLSNNATENLLKSFSSNTLSAVIVANIGKEKMLFGADMENIKKYGWDDYLSNVYKDNIEGCKVFKIPHHGSSNAYSKKTVDLLDKPIAVITRYNRGVHPLPDDEMIQRYQNDCKVFVVGKKVNTKPNMGLECDINKKANIIDDGPGFVRLLMKKGSESWKIEKYGSVEEY